ncbi:hypothetical protein SeLEV6574_g07097 [Synchytrium endobioticum]|uniref:Uncharacterized protein n=1 Tax=Synchytrium endobioticum TaxID=286115 RepID=A0A507CJ60_9FUNG|nr:hypothetical protein SeLEV6574_g07097 [Synchytrium endobioticum]
MPAGDPSSVRSSPKVVNESKPSARHTFKAISRYDGKDLKIKISVLEDGTGSEEARGLIERALDRLCEYITKYQLLFLEIHERPRGWFRDKNNKAPRWIVRDMLAALVHCKYPDNNTDYWDLHNTILKDMGKYDKGRKAFDGGVGTVNGDTSHNTTTDDIMHMDELSPREAARRAALARYSTVKKEAQMNEE